MLTGLNALNDDGIVGYFVDPKSKKQHPWIIQNGKLSSSTIMNYKIKNTKIKIAVLIDARTGSSGEMTAISFLGLPNVKVFGQPSADYTTANNNNFYQKYLNVCSQKDSHLTDSVKCIKIKLYQM